MEEHWSSIEEAAESLGISERTCWRWLQSGKLIRTQNDEGEFFTLGDTGNSSDNGTHTPYSDNHDMSDCDTTLMSMSDGMRRSRVREKGKNKSCSFDPTAALRKELEANRLELDLERLEDFRLQREDRKAQIRREKMEQEKLRLEQERLKYDREQKIRLEQETQEREKDLQEKRAKEVQETIRRVKDSIPFLKSPEIIPPQVFLELNLNLDGFFKKIDVMAYSLFELRQMAEGVCIEALKPYADKIQEKVEDRCQVMLQKYWEQEIVPKFREEYEKASRDGRGKEFLAAVDKIMARINKPSYSDSHIQAIQRAYMMGLHGEKRPF